MMKLKHFQDSTQFMFVLLVCSEMLCCVMLKLKHFQDSTHSVFVVVGLFRNDELSYAYTEKLSR